MNAGRGSVMSGNASADVALLTFINAFRRKSAHGQWITRRWALRRRGLRDRFVRTPACKRRAYYGHTTFHLSDNATASISRHRDGCAKPPRGVVEKARGPLFALWRSPRNPNLQYVYR